MNAIKLIIDGYGKIFKGTDALLKNISLFALTGILSTITVYFEEIKETKTMPADMSVFFAAIIGFIIISIYLYGYTLNFMNKAFSVSDENILPDVNFAPVGIFFKVLPLTIVWGLYTCVIIAIIALTIPSIPVISILLAVLLAIILVFVTFVYVAFCENFDAKGLFDITLPFKFLKPATGMLVILGLLFIPVAILSLVPSLLAGIILGISGFGGTNIPAYVGGLLGGYFGLIAQLVWYYCLVQIYREKIKPIM